MINLGIDCSSNWTSVGLSDGGTILSEIHLNIARRQSVCLPEAIDRLLGFSGYTLRQVDRLVLNTGPGSFTGVRVGLSYGLALAAALDCPVVPVNALEIPAIEASSSASPGTRIAPVLWAKRGYVYGAIYKKPPIGADLSVILAPGFFSQAALLEHLSPEIAHILVVIEKERHCDLFADFHTICKRASPSGGALSLLGDLLFERACSFQEVKGLYLRPPDIG